MTVALILLSYTTVLVALGPSLLTRGRWTHRAPRLGIVAWQSVSAAVVAGAALAGLALLLSQVPLTTDLDHLLMACSQVLRGRSSSPGRTLAAVGGTVLFVAVVGKASYRVVRAVAGAARHRARHRAMLALAGSAHVGQDALVLDRAEPALYCLPGRRERIVVTTGALALLDDDQLAAALAHERAHLRQRHDLVIANALGLARAFPRVRLFRDALTETTRLVELLADDVAARSTDRLTLADALLTLSSGQALPVVGLAATGASAARVQRLIAPPRPLGRARSVATGLFAAVLLAAPLSSVAGPGNVLGQSCPAHAGTSVQQQRVCVRTTDMIDRPATRCQRQCAQLLRCVVAFARGCRRPGRSNGDTT